MTTRVLPVLVLLTMLLTLPPPTSAATLAVTDCGDSGGPNQLRQVIAAASPGDTVIVPACTITLTTGSTIIINKSLTINGTGAQRTIIDGGGITQMFNIATGTVVISDVTLQNAFVGLSIGGAVFVAGGSLTLKNSLVTHNHAKGSGGIQNQATLTLIGSTVSGNTASSANAGGIGSFGNTTLVNSTVSGNSGPVGGIDIALGTLTVTSSTIAGNTGTGNVGGIARSGGTATLGNTILANNVGGNCSGTITSIGHNLDSANTCGFDPTHNLVNTNRVNPLADLVIATAGFTAGP